MLCQNAEALGGRSEPSPLHVNIVDILSAAQALEATPWLEEG